MKKLKWIIGVPIAIAAIALLVVAVLLKSYDYNRFKAPVAEAVKKATGRTLTIGGDIGLDLGLTPSLVVEGIRFQNAPWGSRPDLATVKRFEVRVALVPLISRRVEVKRLVLVEPDILVETDAKGRTNLEFTPKAASTPEKAETGKPDAKEGGGGIFGLVFNELRIENGRLTFRDGKSGKSFHMALERLDAATNGPDKPLALNLKGAYQEAPLTVQGTLGPLTSISRKGVPWPLDLAVSAPDTDLRVKGAVTDLLSGRGLDLKIDLDCKKPSSLARLAEARLPFDPPVRFSGRLSDPAPATYRISDMDLAVGKSDLSGTLAVALGGKRPAVTADLKSKKIDLREFMAKPEQEKPQKGAAPTAPPREKVFPADPLPVAALKSADATLTLKGAQILLPKVAVDNLELGLVLQDGRLHLTPLSASAGGGSLAGRLSLIPRGKDIVMAGVLKIDKLDVGRMLKELGIFDAFEGSLDLDVDLKGAGGSVAALMAGLDGRASAVMDGGRISNALIHSVGGDLSSGLFRLVNPLGKKEDWTAINCLVVRFDSRRGLADASALVFDTSVMSVIGQGEVNLATEALDLSLKPVPKEGVGVQGLGKISMSLSELTKPFKLGGTLARPKLAVDTAAAALAVGKAVGGVALFGPLGIATALMSGNSAGDENPCVAALAIAREGAVKKKSVATKASRSQTGTADSSQTATGGIGSTLKKLFGD